MPVFARNPTVSVWRIEDARNYYYPTLFWKFANSDICYEIVDEPGQIIQL